MGLCGMGSTFPRRGDGRGEVKGDAVRDLGARGNPPRGTGKPDWATGLDPVCEGEESGVAERAICHGAGEERRMTVCRTGGCEASAMEELRCRQRTSSTAFSRAEPARDD